VGTTNRVVDGPRKMIPPKREKQRKSLFLQADVIQQLRLATEVRGLLSWLEDVVQMGTGIQLHETAFME
jgi:hypothetical protein